MKKNFFLASPFLNKAETKYFLLNKFWTMLYGQWNLRKPIIIRGGLDANKILF